MRTARSSFVIAIGWLLLITILLCIPGTKLPKLKWDERIWLDKWIHVILFGVLVFLWCRSYVIQKVQAKTKKIFVLIMILTIVYGIGMEIVQHYFIPFRSFDFGDMIADSIGAVVGYFIASRRFLKNR